MPDPIAAIDLAIRIYRRVRDSLPPVGHPANPPFGALADQFTVSLAYSRQIAWHLKRLRDGQGEEKGEAEK